MDDLLGFAATPYSLSDQAVESLKHDLETIEERVALLRRNEVLTEETLRRFYGEKRFEQIAESNAIEGSTLSVGETQLAILKGTTLTGHDPAFVRDARALHQAYLRLERLACVQTPTDLGQIHELHKLILGDRPGAGIFRRERVRISGSPHQPPKTWEEIMSAMEDLEHWSIDNANLPALLRATIIHAWFVHIHPYIDGNGRTARALTTLELIRAGFPPIVIRRTQERERYIEALRTSDEAGNLGPFLDLIFERAQGALLGLERAAAVAQGYDAGVERVRRRQERRLQVWNTGVELFFRLVVHFLGERIEAVHGRMTERYFRDALELDDYIELCHGHPVSRSWTFEVSCDIPGSPPIGRLAWTGFRSPEMASELHGELGPTLFWSVPNSAGYPPWVRAQHLSPWAEELTIVGDRGDEWCIRTVGGEMLRVSPSEAARNVADAFLSLTTNTLS